MRPSLLIGAAAGHRAAIPRPLQRARERRTGLGRYASVLVSQPGDNGRSEHDQDRPEEKPNGDGLLLSQEEPGQKDDDQGKRAGQRYDDADLSQPQGGQDQEEGQPVSRGVQRIVTHPFTVQIETGVRLQQRGDQEQGDKASRRRNGSPTTADGM